MRAPTIFSKGLRISLAAILCVTALSAAGRTARQELPKNGTGNIVLHPVDISSQDFSLGEIFSQSQQEAGEAYYFFLPKKANDPDRYTYVYDTKFDRLLLFPAQQSLIDRIEGREIDPEDWPQLLNDLILDIDQGPQKGKRELRSPLKVVDLDENWVKFTLEGRNIVLPRKLMVEEWSQRNLPLGQEVVDKRASLPEGYFPDDLVKIPQKWNFHTQENPKYLRKYVARMIERMLRNAEEQGIHIRVFSAYRSYDKQRYLYLNAVSRYGEHQNGVAAPGHSEHQLGTAVDLCGLDPGTVLNPHFGRTKEGSWLRENAPKFGFFQSYTEENRQRTGYIPEPWHFRFFGKNRSFSGPNVDRGNGPPFLSFFPSPV